MRPLRGIGLGFAVALAAIIAPTPALADNRLFTFPDPAIYFVRQFAPQKIEMLDTGPVPLARISLPATYPIGTQLRIQGSVAVIGGATGSFSIYPYGTTGFNITAAGTFDQTITLADSTNEIIIYGHGRTSATITALTVDEVI
jgi:hypothetical protein